MKERTLLFYKLTLLAQLLIIILLFIFNIWTTMLIRLSFYLIFVLVSFSCIYLLLYTYISFDLKISFAHNTTLFKLTYFLFEKLNYILELLIVYSQNINLRNDKNFEKYLKNCPFSLSSDLFSYNTSYYENRRCELYNIYMNSRYKYQYICSYNASSDFENDKSGNGLDKVICIPKISNNSKNNIIKQFSAIYENNDSQLFYCNRIDLPIKDAYIKDEYCNNKRNLVLPFSKVLLITNILSLFFRMLYEQLLDYSMARTSNEILNHPQRFLGDNNDNCSTDNDECNSNNSSFDEENDGNIIVENNKVYNFDFNIKDYIENRPKSE